MEPTPDARVLSQSVPRAGNVGNRPRGIGRRRLAEGKQVVTRLTFTEAIGEPIRVSGQHCEQFRIHGNWPVPAVDFALPTVTMRRAKSTCPQVSPRIWPERIPVSRADRLGCIHSDQDRVVLIEDTYEAQMTKPNSVRFEARREQAGLLVVTIRDLLRATLRHRPDRIILGEVRGGEAFDLLQALNTGHSGTLSTIHANSAAQALSRFTSCVLESGVELPYQAIRANIGDSLHLLVHLDRRNGRRLVREALRLERFDPVADRYITEPAIALK
jgi:hypothetical protein